MLTITPQRKAHFEIGNTDITGNGLYLEISCLFPVLHIDKTLAMLVTANIYKQLKLINIQT